VLARTGREQGEVPFAFDRDGRLLAADDAGRAQLQALGLDPAHLPPQTILAGWLVVSRRDDQRGLVLGIARPLSQSLAAARRTAVTNLCLGLAMIGLALLGILPLASRMTRNLERLSEGAERLGHGDLAARVPVRSHDELGRLAGTFNRMAEELGEHQKRLLDEERLRKELEMCRRIQEELLPRQPLPLPFGEVKGVSIPARELGGDFFNYFSLPDGAVALLVGDVSGKGIGAALLMANLQATLRARLPLEPDLSRLAESLDREIEGNTPPESYLTLFMAVLDPQGRSLRYVNAGHNPQLLLRRGGELQRLPSSGRPLGLLPGGGYQEEHLPIGGGDSLFLFTDGLAEAENPAGEPFEARLLSLLQGLDVRCADDLLLAVERAVHEHRGDGETADDATMVALTLSEAFPDPARL
jgi:sigma-B regulation protein RsbU (phosphoserine phosphatase)